MLDLELIDAMRGLETAGTPFCVATIVDARGSVPQVVGARALFTAAGLCHGTVGGGRLEARVAEEARALIEDGGEPTRFVRWNIQRDLGMTCGGEVALFLEVHGAASDWSIVVFGAGHVAQKLCRFLAELDCRVTCIDTRSEWLERLAGTARVEPRRVERYRDGIEAVADGSYVIVMTGGHHSDLPILEALARSEARPAFLGVIGSDSKARVLARDLRAAGVAGEFIERIICPIGDKLGNNTPAEISFGIVAQLLRHRRQGGNR